MQKAKDGNGEEDSDSVYGGGGGSGSWLLYDGEVEDACGWSAGGSGLLLLPLVPSVLCVQGKKEEEEGDDEDGGCRAEG